MKVRQGMSRRRAWMLAPVAGAGAALAFAAAGLAATPNTWTPVPDMGTARFTPAAAVLSDGRVLVAGGVTSSSSATQTAEIFDPAHDTWSPAADMAAPLGAGEAAVLPGGKVLVVGSGASATAPVSEVYDPAHDTWTPTADDMQDAHAAGGIEPLPDGRFLVVGGGSMVTDRTDIYDPATNSFTPGADLPTSLVGSAVAPLPGGKVLVAGGYDNSQVSVGTAYVYTPDGGAGSWQPTASQLSVPRGQPAGAPLPSGKVLIAGGSSSPDPSTATPIRSAEVYDPATGDFDMTGSMRTGRILPSAAALANGRVVVAGGLMVVGGAQSLLASAEAYDPATGAWSPAGTMSTARAGFPLVRLGGGDLLAAGGVGSVDSNGLAQSILASAERYAPPAPPSPPASPSPPAQPVPPASTVPAPPPAAPRPDTKAPRLKLHGVKRRMTLKRFRRGVHVRISPSEPSALDVSLLAYARRATIARVYNLTLATRHTRTSARTRKLTLKPRRALLGHARRFRVQLSIVATGRAGNRRTITRTIRVRG